VARLVSLTEPRVGNTATQPPSIVFHFFYFYFAGYVVNHAREMAADTMMMIYEHAVDDSLSSPPGMTASNKSSKSSSFHSVQSVDNGDLADVANFEDIGLGDEAEFDAHRLSDQHFKTAPNPYSPNFSADLRAASVRQVSPSTLQLPTFREEAKPRPKRELATRVQTRPSFPSLKNQVNNANIRGASGLFPAPPTSPLPSRDSSQRRSKSRGSRSPSPVLSLNPRDPNLMMKPRRSSWQSLRERKTAVQLELECDEDDGDDIPDGLVLDNVPISPRPPLERSKSQPNSKATSPERLPKKERVRSVGNGTPAVAVAQGSLRSPSWKSDSGVHMSKSMSSSRASSPSNSRAKSWTSALADLNAEAKALTEKLEEHADEMKTNLQRASTWSMPAGRTSPEHYSAKPRVKSAFAELPPLRRTNIMIDPLPISKEKEAVLSRTRPSWLPPKNPEEERRHLKEYQKMMTQSREADRRREASKRARSECRDTAADSLMHIWEDDILPRWNDAIRERRTRELWWRGIAPRSRGAVWSLAIANELGLTEKSYEMALNRAQEAEDRLKSNVNSTNSTDPLFSSWFDAIEKDVEEHTWRDLRIFQHGGPLHQGLVDVLRAYAMYRSDIGYISGCNVSLPQPWGPLIRFMLTRPYRPLPHFFS
jgi:hypothetical protein